MRIIFSEVEDKALVDLTPRKKTKNPGPLPLDTTEKTEDLGFH